MKKFLPVLFLLGCQDTYKADRPYAVTPQTKEYFTQLQGVEIHNPNYPVNIKLKDNGTFWYKFNKLGEGEGHWHYDEKDGLVRLRADRKMFQMNFELRASDNGPALEFSDRFGPKFYQMTTAGAVYVGN